jgi:hypothetical protein
VAVTREWLTTWLTGHLTRAGGADAPPVAQQAEEMVDEMMQRWLGNESSYWLAASQKRGLTLSQRTMRLQVSRFYDDRLRALLSRSGEEVAEDATAGDGGDGDGLPPDGA